MRAATSPAAYTATHTASRRRGVPLRAIVGTGAALALVAAMALDTHVVRIGSEQDVRAEAFSPEAYGVEHFPRIQSLVEERAVDAAKLANAVAADKDAAAKDYGMAGGIGPIFPVSFTGTVGEGRSGIFDVAVPGLPEGTRVRVQTGPAINGTELRDIPGDIAFGDFTNQIEYQNAGAAINDAMKEAVLAGLDRESLTGRQISVTGAFRMINPKSWLVTPVRLSVQ